MRALTLALAILAALIGLAALVTFSTSAQIALGRLASERNVEVRRDVGYGPGKRQVLDVYEPAGGDRRSPVVLFIHGGNWRMGDRRLYGFLGAAFASRGIAAVVPDYRLFPQVRFPAFVEDAALAYRWTAENLKGRRIFVMGHSAGAHTAALLAYDGRYVERAAPGAPRPAGFIGLAGPYAFDPTTWESTSDIFAPATGNADEARPVTFVNASSPPSLLFHGAADDVVKRDNQRTLAKALKDAGVEVRALEPKGAGHIGVLLSFARPLRWIAPTFDESVAFIKRVAGRAEGVEADAS